MNEQIGVYLHIKSQFPIKTILQEKAFSVEKVVGCVLTLNLNMLYTGV